MSILAKYSVNEYHKMIATGILNDNPVELIEGKIVKMSPERPLHSFVNYRGVIYLRSLLENQAEIREAHPITLSNSEPEPDLAIVRSPDTLYSDRHPYPQEEDYQIHANYSYFIKAQSLAPLPNLFLILDFSFSILNSQFSILHSPLPLSSRLLLNRVVFSWGINIKYAFRKRHLGDFC